MSTSISSSNKGNIITGRNKTNNSDNDRDSVGNSSGDSDTINESFNEDYSTMIIYIQDDPDILVNYETRILYVASLKSGD